MSDLMIDQKQGGRYVERAELDLIPMPEETRTFTPISHLYLVNTFEKIGRDLLTGYEFAGDRLAIARDGRQLWGMLTFKKDRDDILLTVGFTNSYDKSLAIKLAIGGCVVICQNGLFTGDIATFSKKHSANVRGVIEDLAITTIYRHLHTFDRIIEDARRLNARIIGDRTAFEAIGVMFGNEILSPRQATKAIAEWKNPSYPEFEPRTAYSLLNACTEALKTSPPLVAMEKHSEAYKTIIDI